MNLFYHHISCFLSAQFPKFQMDGNKSLANGILIRTNKMKWFLRSLFQHIIKESEDLSIWERDKKKKIERKRSFEWIIITVVILN